MSQISMPIRIVVAVAVIFMAAWMTILKPKSADPVTPAPAGNVANGTPAVTGLGKAAESAKTAANATNNHSSAVDSAGTTGTLPGVGTAPATGTAPAKGTTPATGKAAGPALTGVPAPIARAMAANQVIALLFWNPKSADDRAVRAALKHVDRWNGRVYVASAPVTQINRYGRIARGVDVEQSPTIVVVDRDLRATTLVGYNPTQAIDQAVVDALRASGGLFADAYLRKVSDACAASVHGQWAIPDARSMGQVQPTVKRYVGEIEGFATHVQAMPAPAKWRALKRSTVADAQAMAAVWSSFGARIGAHPSAAKLVTEAAAAGARIAPITKRFNARMDKQHVVSCGSDA